MSKGGKRLKLTIVGGFLGSGKTTWLRHQLHEGRFADAHVLVNEAAGTPVDHSLLGLANDLTVLSGGCACCDGKGALEAALLTICDARSKTGDPARELTEIVLETSGLADPAAIAELVQSHPVLIRHILVSDVIVVVDALYGLAALKTEPLARAQISAADGLVITKSDEADPRNVAYLRAVLAYLAPAVAQSGASFGADIDLPEAIQVPLDLPAFAGATTGAIRVCSLELGNTPDWTVLTLWLSSLLHARGDQIVRVKGVVTSAAGDLLVQAVRTTVQSPEKLPYRPGSALQNELILIGTGVNCDEIQKSYERFLSLG
ncbi:MAG: GTP-binding protein [Pseudomonadota bacterium]